MKLSTSGPCYASWKPCVQSVATYAILEENLAFKNYQNGLILLRPVLQWHLVILFPPGLFQVPPLALPCEKTWGERVRLPDTAAEGQFLKNGISSSAARGWTHGHHNM